MSGRSRAPRPCWYASQIALVAALSLFASHWMAYVVPIVALYLAVGAGVVAGVVPWFVDWSQRRRGAVLVGGAVVVGALGSGPLIARLLAYLAAAVGGVLVARVREPMAPVLPALLVVLLGALVSDHASAGWLASAVPFAASALLLGVLRQRALAPVVPLDLAVRGAGQTLRPTRSRYVALPTIGLSAAVALVVTAVIPLSGGPRPGASLGAGFRSTPTQPGQWLDDVPGDPEPIRREPWSGAPPSIAALADDLQTGRGTTVERLDRLQAAVRVGVEDVVHTSRAALTATALEQVLRSRQGTPEQKAAVVVAVARTAGYDARLARGQLPIDERTAIAPFTWAEVHFDGIGWACVETTDRAIVREAGTPVSAARSIDWAASGARQRLSAVLDAAGRSAWWAIAWALLRVLLGVAVILATSAVVVALAGSVIRVARRRFRRTTDDPPGLVDGAWAELVDLARACGT